ncbi:MgtC/SapB family protein [Sphingomonas xanthus]|uniref:MgtC/SapB family protein n=1 Tax=Sphingomonas xanthus TaxID=2594473 RepID=A0A516ISC1_9SPHN|nr:DUF4010 domain-containing protein [Sphingomonas xanthus]QDP19795.1 MgtC/SapB family protein [Sphingomonas xanthus]
MITGLEPWAQDAIRVGAGLIAGALIGLERGFNLRGQRDGTRVAGIRTFSLLGFASAIAGLIGHAQPIAAGAIVAGALAILAIAYAPKLKAKSDATSPIAAVTTVSLAFLAGYGAVGMALAGAAVVILLLALKDELHNFVDRLDERDIKAFARFAVIALAILPFLPDHPFGPFDAWNAAKLWWVMILVTGFSFAGYIANRFFGARHGTVVTAIIGGAYSSTAVTQSLAQRLGSDEAGGAEPAGIALASAVMYLRVLLLVALLATRVFIDFAVVITPVVIVGLAAGWWLYRKAPMVEGPAPPGNPIALVPALAFLLFLAGAAVAARWAQSQFGQEGIAVLILLMGSLDVDAAIITVGGLPQAAISPPLAALALGGTILANMSVKLGITLAYARGKGIGAALALGASMAALTTSLVFGWLWLPE